MLFEGTVFDGMPLFGSMLGTCRGIRTEVDADVPTTTHHTSFAQGYDPDKVSAYLDLSPVIFRPSRLKTSDDDTRSKTKYVEVLALAQALIDVSHRFFRYDQKGIEIM